MLFCLVGVVSLPLRYIACGGLGRYCKREGRFGADLEPNTGHNSFDDEPWILKLVEFTRKVLQQDRVRLIGVCFGHQIIGRALDQKVGRSDRGWEVSVTPMQLTEKGRELFGVQEVVSIRFLLTCP